MAGRRERPHAVTWLMPLGTLLEFMLPRWALAPLAAPIAGLLQRFSAGNRARLEENLRHVLGPAVPEREIRAATRRIFTHYVLNIIDLLRIPVLRRRVASYVDLDRRWLDRLLAEKRGLLVVTGHIGNYDLAGACLAACGFPISAVIEPVPRGWAGTYNRYREATRLEAIPMSDRDAMSRALLDHRILALVSDRDLSGNGILCPAFDSYRFYPRGAAAYALRHGSPLAVACCVFQHKPGRPPYRILHRELLFAPSGDASADVAALTRRIAESLNTMISTYADQWLVFKAGWQTGS